MREAFGEIGLGTNAANCSLSIASPSPMLAFNPR